tara:strand:+ start:159 stop:1799 length:1641 start_codon:yes stop_codon:yes gene_type:complete
MSLTVVFSTKKIDYNFVEIIKATSGVHNIEVIPYENPGKYSLTELYNKGLKDSANNVVVFCHDDIKFDTKNWGRKVLNHFKKNKELGILGVAGSRYMPSSGKWWEDFSKMHGAVYHEHEGKRWLSRYSKDIGNYLDDVVLVDGLFFGVNKNNIKLDFNEEVSGFHFYDVDFSFSNYLAGVKVSVCSNIKITHLSIGMTNNEWEKNREVFAEKYKEHLPIKIDRQLRKKESLNILIGCLNFNDYTGSELHIYELAKGLKKAGHNVSICSNVGGVMKNRAKGLGIPTYQLNEPPGFRLGDGKSQVMTPQGPQLTKEGQLYKLKEVKFDIMHLHHKPVTEHLLRLFPQTPVITTIHSEVIELEHPVIDDRISKYICIRPEIKDYITEVFEVEEKKTSVIYNPFDTQRFKPHVKPNNKNKRILFVGTIDYIRQDTILHLIESTKEQGKELWILGKKKSDYLDDLNESHVTYIEPTWDVEKYIKQCDETAGILLGRTTIEGWLCDRPGWIYDVDSSGNISSYKLHEVPEDVDKFKSEKVIEETIKEYIKII